MHAQLSIGNSSEYTILQGAENMVTMETAVCTNVQKTAWEGDVTLTVATAWLALQDIKASDVTRV